MTRAAYEKIDYNHAWRSGKSMHGFIIGSTPILRDLVEANLLVNPFPSGVATDIGYDLVTTETAQSRSEVATFIDWTMNQARSGEIHEPGVVSITSH